MGGAIFRLVPGSRPALSTTYEQFLALLGSYVPALTGNAIPEGLRAPAPLVAALPAPAERKSFRNCLGSGHKWPPCLGQFRLSFSARVRRAPPLLRRGRAQSPGIADSLEIHVLFEQTPIFCEFLCFHQSSHSRPLRLGFAMLSKFERKWSFGYPCNSIGVVR